MGEIYKSFTAAKKASQQNCIFDNVNLVKFEHNSKNYEIYLTKKHANKYSFIHCKNNTIEWEQFPVLPRLLGTSRGYTTPLITLTSPSNCVKIVVISGKPNCITGLDEGIFRSVHKYDENHINVMSSERFREL